MTRDIFHAFKLTLKFFKNNENVCDIKSIINMSTFYMYEVLLAFYFFYQSTFNLNLNGKFKKNFFAACKSSVQFAFQFYFINHTSSI